MSQVDIQAQKPFTLNQITAEKPNVPRTKSVISGYAANSFNAGHNKAIFWHKAMAGSKYYSLNFAGNFQMLTPLTPAYQKLKATAKVYFVPNSRVMKDYDKFVAQKGGTTVEKIEELPNLYDTKIQLIKGKLNNEEYYVPICNTVLWRDSFISSYLPRTDTMRKLIDTNSQEIEYYKLPALNVLPLRGRVAIYNDMERNKEYQEAVKEYNDNTVSPQEWDSYCPDQIEWSKNRDYYTMRARRDNSYYTDYRTDIQGFETEFPANLQPDQAVIKWLSNFENYAAEVKSQAENAQKNDWDVMSELRGSRKLTEGKIQLVGQQTFNLNYSAITQSTYNNNETIDERFRVMGKQGAYSYTEINIPLFTMVELIEDGFFHVIINATADSVFEKAFDRQLLNVKWNDEYRPDLEEEKFDVLYECEMNVNAYNPNEGENANPVRGFKRKFSEYFKMPNVIGGDMTNEGYYDLIGNVEYEQAIINITNPILSNSTFQFFEETDNGLDYNSDAYKKPWLDYTDLLINKNQAIKNTVYSADQYSVDADDGDVFIGGQNQIFFVGVFTAIVDLPINEEIKKNYTTWGEH